jgi:hypothetical protein
MATAAPPFDRLSLPSSRRYRRHLSSVGATLRRVAFWLAVALPVGYLPFVFAPGVVRDGLATAALRDPGAAGVVLVMLAVVHLLSALVGHGHPGRRDTARGDTRVGVRGNPGERRWWFGPQPWYVPPTRHPRPPGPRASGLVFFKERIPPFTAGVNPTCC